MQKNRLLITAVEGYVELFIFWMLCAVFIFMLEEVWIGICRSGRLGRKDSNHSDHDFLMSLL